jgi:hypothetical protein
MEELLWCAGTVAVLVGLAALNDRAVEGPLGRLGAQVRGELFARADGRTAFAAYTAINGEE